MPNLLPPKDKRVELRITTADYDVLCSRAIASGVSLSVIMRRAIRAYVTAQSPPPSKRPEPQQPASRYLASSDGRAGA